MKHLLFCSALATIFVASAFGATVTIPSTYDEATDQWIGDVVALTNELRNIKSNNTVIELSKGIYDLTPIKDSYMYTSDSYGKAILSTSVGNKSGIKVKGATGNPADVVLTVSGSSYRVFWIGGDDKGNGIYDLTITGGNASSSSGKSNYRGGGAAYLAKGSIVSNCVFYGNRADYGGGAVCGALGASTGRKGVVYDSVFYANNSTQKGCAGGSTTFYNCIFSNNQVTAGTAYTGSVVYNSYLYDCVLIGNTANGCGGLRDGKAFGTKFIDNHDLSSNYANPGGGGARDSDCTNCFFYGNSAPRFGGAVRGGTLVDCVIVSNRTDSSNEPSGGGVCEATSVINCLVVSNYTAGAGGGLWKCPYVCNVTSSYNRAEGNGGGLYSCTTVDCSVVAYNYAADNGGGACYGALTNCVLRGNVAGSGGGMYGGTAVGCVFTDNANSSAEGTTLIGCDIDTSPVVSIPLADRCVLHEISNKADLMKAVGNVAYPDGKANSFTYVINGATLMRNCLVTNCYAQGNSTYNNNNMFTGRTKTRVENCTFDKNTYRNFVRYADDATTPISFVNCAINGTVSYLNTAYMSLSNCVYKAITTKDDWPEGFGPKGCKKVTDMKFLGTGEHPYTPKRKSPLIGYGQVLDWMREGGAIDLAGNPMLKSPDATTVDVGAYQCWIPAPGALLFLR